MAILKNNMLVKGFSGKVGDMIVFRNLRGKTILSNKAKPPKKQSDLQKANRSKFREASCYAKRILRTDPEKKIYYQKMAKKLKLPNAYTAAIADYMRSVKVEELKINKREGQATYQIYKNNFRITNADVQVHDEAGVLQTTQTTSANANGECMMVLPDYPPNYTLTWTVTDAANKLITISMKLG